MPSKRKLARRADMAQLISRRGNNRGLGNNNNRGQSSNLARLEIFFEGARQPRSLCTVSTNLLTHVCCAAHRQFLGDPSSASLPSVLKANLPKLPYAHRNRVANRVPSPTTLLLPARRPKATAPLYSLFTSQRVEDTPVHHHQLRPRGRGWARSSSRCRPCCRSRPGSGCWCWRSCRCWCGCRSRRSGGSRCRS